MHALDKRYDDTRAVALHGDVVEGDGVEVVGDEGALVGRDTTSDVIVDNRDIEEQNEGNQDDSTINGTTKSDAQMHTTHSGIMNGRIRLHRRRHVVERVGSFETPTTSVDKSPLPNTFTTV